MYVEVLRDVVLGLSPLRDTDADEMLREVKDAPHPRISELDINPLRALEKGVMAVDARVQPQAT